jgi:hypothetical protein
MKFGLPGPSVRKLSLCLFAAISAASTPIASAEVYHGISNTQKVATVSEPFNQAAQLRLGAHVGAGGDKILSVGGNAVYVFGQNTAGNWVQTAKLTAYDSGVLTGPIAFDGTYALVRGYTPARASVVYSYRFDAGQWRALGVLKGTTGFGEAIALDGCTALIGSARPVLVETRSLGTRAYVHYFDRCRTGNWTWINSFSPTTDDTFGSSLALTGSEVLVGSPGGGRVYYYAKSGDAWQLRQTLTGNITWPDAVREPATQGAFGTTVARQGDVALVRMAKTYKVWKDVKSREGIVLQFTLTNGMWTQTGQMEPFNSPEYPYGWDLFGARIALTPNWAYIAAPGNVGIYSIDGYSLREHTGSVWAYPRNGNTFGAPEMLNGGEYIIGPEGDWKPSGGQLGSYFGQDIALLGNSLVVGWPMKSLVPYEVNALKTGATVVFTPPSP